MGQDEMMKRKKRNNKQRRRNESAQDGGGPRHSSLATGPKTKTNKKLEARGSFIIFPSKLGRRETIKSD